MPARDFYHEPIGQLVLRRNHLRLIVFDAEEKSLFNG